MAGDTGMAGKVALLLWAQTLGLAGAQSTQLLVEPPWTPAVLWDRVTLTCQGSGTAGATTWYKDRKRWWTKGPDSLTVTSSGTYTCDRPSTGRSAHIHVLNVPVANATVTPGPPALRVRAGEPVTLRCSVQVGSAPVTFTWLRHGQEVARGPLLELGDVDVGHSGTYQCVATNQLGRDGRRVSWAFSAELALEVTSWGRGGTVAIGILGSLLFLVLLTGIIVAFHWWHHMGARKHQERAPPEHLARPGKDPQATYMELQGPHGRPWELSDIYDSLQQKL